MELESYILEESKTESQAPSIGRSALWGTLAKIASVVTNFLIGILIARALGADGKGMYAFIQQMVGVLTVVLGLGLSTSNVYFVASKKVRAKDATANSIWLAAATSLIAAVVLYLFLAGPFAPEPPYSTNIVLVSIALFFSTMLFSWFSAISAGINGLKVQSIASIVSVFLGLAVAIALWVLGCLNAGTMLFVGVVAQASGALVVLLLEIRKMPWLKPNFLALREMVPYSMGSYLVNLVGYLHLRQDILILGWLAPLKTIGVYSVAVSFAEILRYIPLIMNAALFSNISHDESTSGGATAAFISRITVLFVAVSVMVFALAIPFGIPLLYGSSFAGATTLFFILLPGTICISLSESASAYLFAKEIVYWQLSTVAVIFNFVLNIVLIPQLGSTGAALASSITYALFSAAILRLACKASGLSPRKFLIPTRTDVTQVKRSISSLLQVKGASKNG